MLAPPGYGKTTAIQRWRRELIASGHQALMLPPAALQDLGALSLALLNRPARPNATPSEVAASAVERANRSARPIAILADDVDAMSESVGAVFAELFLDPRAPYRVVLAGTSAPPHVSAPRLVGYGLLTVVDHRQLAYTWPEAIGFVVPAGAEEELAGAASRLVVMSAGWPVAIDALRRIIRDGGDARGIRQRLSNAVDAWVEARLWLRLSAEHREALGALALLQRETVDCGILGATCQTADPAGLLDELARLTPFLIREGGRHRVLPLLAGLGSAPMAANSKTLIHDRVARWLAAAGRLEEAIPHALAARRVELARDCIERALIDAVARGGVVDALRWLDTLPADLTRADRGTVLAVVWALAIGGRTDLVQTWLDALDQLPPHTLSSAAHERAVIEGLLASVRDAPDDALAALEPFRNFPLDGITPPVVAVRGNMFRWIDQQRDGRETDVARRLSRSDSRRDPANFYSYCFAAFRDAETLIDLGQSGTAVGLMRPLRDRAQAQFGSQGAPYLIASVALAAALRQSGDADEAHLTLLSCATWPEPVSLPSVLWLRTCTAARLARRDGDWPRALRLCDALAAHAATKSLPRLHALSLAEAIRTLVTSRVDTGLGERAAALRRLHAQAVGLGPIRGGLTKLAAMIGLAHADRVSEPTEAIAWLEAARPLAQAHNRLLALAEIDHLLREMTHRPPGDPMIDEADHATLIQDCAASKDGSAADRSPLSTRIEIALTTKEIEVLELLTAGLSNKRIAEAMMVSAETVKWHLKNIFNKLGVHDREHVMARARALDLA